MSKAPTISRFHHLNTYLSGEAADTSKRLAETPENYEVAVELCPKVIYEFSFFRTEPEDLNEVYSESISEVTRMTSPIPIIMRTVAMVPVQSFL